MTKDAAVLTCWKAETLDTLAQTGTPELSNQALKGQILVNGAGTDLNQSGSLQKRAKRKMITQKLILNLIEVAKRKKQPEWVKAYRNSYYCQNKLVSANGKLYGKYCKNRFCPLCCSIRKAEIINTYLPIIQSWPDPYFVTLTVKSVPAKKLRFYVDNLIRAFGIIVERHKKRNQRLTGPKLTGLRVIECNFNPVRRTYNPHLHIIVPDKLTAETLISDWLNLWTKRFARRISQDTRPLYNKTTALIELVKYTSKIITLPNLTDESSSKLPPRIYAAALHNVLGAMKDHRIFERFGFNLPRGARKKSPKVSMVIQYENWEFRPQERD